MRLQTLEAQGPPEIDSAFAALTRDRAGALLILADPLFTNQRRQIAELAAKRRLPAAHTAREFAGAGGLMAYGANLTDLERRAATYVDKILKGTKPGNLPVEPPTKLELVVNMRAAKALGLTLPPSIAARVDHVIE